MSHLRSTNSMSVLRGRLRSQPCDWYLSVFQLVPAVRLRPLWSYQPMLDVPVWLLLQQIYPVVRGMPCPVPYLHHERHLHCLLTRLFPNIIKHMRSMWFIYREMRLMHWLTNLCELHQRVLPGDIDPKLQLLLWLLCRMFQSFFLQSVRGGHVPNLKQMQTMHQCLQELLRHRRQLHSMRQRPVLTKWHMHAL